MDNMFGSLKAISADSWVSSGNAQESVGPYGYLLIRSVMLNLCPFDRRTAFAIRILGMRGNGCFNINELNMAI